MATCHRRSCRDLVVLVGAQSSWLIVSTSSLAWALPQTMPAGTRSTVTARGKMLAEASIAYGDVGSAPEAADIVIDGRRVLMVHTDASQELDQTMGDLQVPHQISTPQRPQTEWGCRECVRSARW